MVRKKWELVLQLRARPLVFSERCAKNRDLDRGTGVSKGSLNRPQKTVLCYEAIFQSLVERRRFKRSCVVALERRYPKTKEDTKRTGAQRG